MIRPQPKRRALALVPSVLWGAVAVICWLIVGITGDRSGTGIRTAATALFFGAGAGLVLHARRALLRELRRTWDIAATAQGVLVRPLPPRVGGLDVAAVQRSADPGAVIGGDVYEVLDTEHGVRALIGDVRGHGLTAVPAAAAVLGCFREAAHEEYELHGVLRRVDRAFARHLRHRAQEGRHPAGEEFVTLLLLEIRGDGVLRAVNCAHPWPYRVGVGPTRPLSEAEPLPPLGAFPLPEHIPVTHCGRMRPDDALILHTDGVTEARDDRGRPFPLPETLTGAARGRPPTARYLLHALDSALLHHTGGSPSDDTALLILHNDARLFAPLPVPGQAPVAHPIP
ncbi:PP2C family protein-serine/threonine phosphatase [Streptomyces sp. MJP52]|uniref:PP2C family protein-serine/threonine phosphatase n=1 Tax=Streptomyces sp. MJP52 TaxID=2940555 RepID=UPI002474D69E|nr:PP2C family protein-serine/threonine phosphatase [Streptomyces sp. MJP52]MDH6224873.1 serine phosphatase RsbU (regulator of sigma subunit) [Streptomyces sp. MJP52]